MVAKQDGKYRVQNIKNPGGGDPKIMFSWFLETVIHKCYQIRSIVCVVVCTGPPVMVAFTGNVRANPTRFLHQNMARNPLNTKIYHLWKNGSLYWTVTTQQGAPFLKVLRILHSTQKFRLHPPTPNVFRTDTNLDKFEKYQLFEREPPNGCQSRNPTGALSSVAGPFPKG